MLTGCNNHPTVKASYHCQQCHKPVCDKCIVNDRFCSTACNAKYSQFVSNYKKPAQLRSNGIVPTLVFLAVVGAAVYASKYYLHLW